MAQYQERKRRNQHKKVARRIPLPGSFEDAGRYFKCWNCGFVCDAERDAEGDTNAPGGVVHVETSRVSGSAIHGSESGKTQVITMVCDPHVVIIPAVDAAGVAKPIVREYEPQGKTGCPQCGTHNWRG